ncbi:unnamed protein product [Allacma fusca]|uniref:Cytochrome P450 n=1 Tax=Allacma fusca TaxID=39272 RepID=A0A8J2PGU0_9HEXA|nr:unnamed protein product [Allacma fusca]
MDLDLIKQVFVKDFDHFMDRRIIDLNKTDILFSKMLTNKSGKEWKDLRSIMSPTFTTDAFGRYTVDVIASIVFGIETDVFTNKDNSVFRNMGKKAAIFTLLWG